MKKHLLILSILAALLLLAHASCGSGAASKEVKAPVAWDTLEELVAQMTLAEKVGQMTQAERVDVHKGDIAKYALGSVLSGGGSVPLNNTPEGWVAMVNACPC